MLKEVVLSRDAVNEMVRHARAALPEEAVGIVGGRPGSVGRTVLPLRNIAGTRAFLADPYAQYQALKQLRQSGLEVLAIYHSHPDGGVEPSASDVFWGAAWPCAHIIIALPAASPSAERIRAWRFGSRAEDCAGVPLLLL